MHEKEEQVLGKSDKYSYALCWIETGGIDGTCGFVRMDKKPAALGQSETADPKTAWSGCWPQSVGETSPSRMLGG